MSQSRHHRSPIVGLIAIGMAVLTGCASSGPPPGAIVLFDGTNLDEWRHGDDRTPEWEIENGELVVTRGAGDLLTRQTFGDCLLYMEWRVEGGGTDQGAGNSGVKIQRRYEVQILDTPPDATPASNLAGGLYALKVPDVNVSRGPEAWQSYLIAFEAPRWEDGQKMTDARMSVDWNGVRVHDAIDMPKGTGGSPPPESPGEDSILLQDHWHNARGPVRFRNIWVLLPPQVDAYANPDVRYRVGERVFGNTPRVRGRTPSEGIRFEITPNLPRGLRFDRRSGTIWGTPRASHALTEYVVTASNEAGSSATRIKIGVLP